MRKILTTTAILLTLSACMTNERPEWMGGEAKRPAADVKIGPRRAPALNQMMQSPPAPQGQREMPSMIVPPPAPAYMVPPPPPPPPADDYYGREKNNMPPALEPKPAPDNRVMNESVRKPFGMDPSYSAATVETAPPPPAPELVVSPETKAAMAAPAAPAEEPKQHNWLSRMSERLSDKPDAPDVEKAKNQPYPKLSDVPQKPEEMAAIKNTQSGRMEGMQEEHEAAQLQRETLAAEPSQTAPGEPQLLGHAYDPKLGPAAGTPKTASVVSTLESPPGEVLPKKTEAPKVAEKPVAKKAAAKKPAKKTPAKKTKPAEKTEPVAAEAPKMSVPEQGLY